MIRKAAFLLLALLLLYKKQVGGFQSIFSIGDKHRQDHPRVNMLNALQDKCDVVVIGSGIGGLSCATILAANYGQNVHVYESHYRPGGCAHSFPIKSSKERSAATFQFDAGPTIVLGCSRAPFNPLMQVLQSVGGAHLIDWIRYDRWGMVTEEGHWPFELGPNKFQSGPLKRFGGPKAIEEFERLRSACAPLCAGAAGIPTMALRADGFRLIPLLRHLDALKAVIPYSDTLNGNFEQLLNNHVSDPWLKAWLDALAFSLSGLNAGSTGAATMAYTLFDLHREGAALDYPRGGFGAIAEALTTVLSNSGGSLHLKSPVDEIVVERGRAVGVKLKSGRFVRAKRGVVCNADIWSLPYLLRNADRDGQLTAKQRQQLSIGSNDDSVGQPKKTKSFMHLHLGLDATGLDLTRLHPHYTVMDKGLYCGGSADPCGDRNMVAVSNPSVLDSSLVDQPNKLVVHAYGAGNEPFDQWSKFDPSSAEYKTEKSKASEFLYRSVSRAFGISEQEVRDRADIAMEGSPLTHKRFLSRTDGTYGATFNSMVPGPQTCLPGLFLCGDSTFPGIGVPAVAVSGANAANTMVSITRHMYNLMK